MRSAWQRNATGSLRTGRPAQAVGGRTDGLPPAPWGSFLLTELVVLVALIMLVGGFFVSCRAGRS